MTYNIETYRIPTANTNTAIERQPTKGRISRMMLAVTGSLALTACGSGEIDTTPAACVAQVEAGGTVWEIAADATSNETSVDDTIAQIRANNLQIKNLGSVQAGTQVRLDQAQCDQLDRSVTDVIADKE